MNPHGGDAVPPQPDEPQRSRGRIRTTAARLTRSHLRHFRGRIEIAIWPGIAVAFAYALYSLGMLTQPERFSNTPAYGTLTQMLHIQVWGLVYLVTAGLFAVYAAFVVSRTTAIIVHIVGLIVTTVWWLAFVIRWLTDEGTTIVNVVSWGVFLLLIGRSASLVPVGLRSTRMDWP
jgi:hypothetical protein